MITDITDFSCRKNGEVNKNKSLYESALLSADNSLYNFTEARKLKPAGELNWKKTTNPDNFLDTNTKRFTEKTNPVKELVAKMKLSETLKYGSTKEDLENEIRESLGIELLKLLQQHGVTGSAVNEIFDIFLEMVGDEPNVDELVLNWNTTEGTETEDSEVVEEESEEEDSGEEITESRKRRPANLNEMVKTLRKRVAEQRIKKSLKESYEDCYEEDCEDIPEPTEGQLRAIVKKYPYLIAPEFGGMYPGETRSYRGENFKAVKAGTMTPEEVYYSQEAKKRNLKDPSSKTYEYLVNNGYDLNRSGSYRDYQV